MASIAPVRVTNLLEVRRSLKGIRDGLKELRQAEIEAAKIVAEDAARRAPRGTRPLPANRRKRLHEAVKPLVKGTKVYVGATARDAPHGNVNHWGGTITPRGKPIRFPPRRFIIEAFKAKREEFIVLLAARLDELFRRNGFH